MCTHTYIYILYICFARVELLDKWMKRKRQYSYSIRLGLPHFGGKYCHTKSQKGSEGTKRDSDSRTAINFHYDSCCKDTVARFCLDTFWESWGWNGVNMVSVKKRERERGERERATPIFLPTNCQKDSKRQVSRRYFWDLLGHQERTETYSTNGPSKPRHKYIPRTAYLHSHALAE